MEFTKPTAEELQHRREFYEQLAELRATQPESFQPLSTAEDVIREDRDR